MALARSLWFGWYNGSSVSSRCPPHNWPNCDIVQTKAIQPKIFIIQHGLPWKNGLIIRSLILYIFFEKYFAEISPPPLTSTFCIQFETTQWPLRISCCRHQNPSSISSETLYPVAKQATTSFDVAVYSPFCRKFRSSPWIPSRIFRCWMGVGRWNFHIIRAIYLFLLDANRKFVNPVPRAA